MPKREICYEMELVVPLGVRKGICTLRFFQNRVTGTLNFFGESRPICFGQCVGQSISFAGTLQTLLYALPYQAEGTVSDDRIDLNLQTEKGVFRAAGHPIRNREGDGDEP